MAAKICKNLQKLLPLKLNTNISLIKYDNGVYTSAVTTKDSIQLFSYDIIL